MTRAAVAVVALALVAGCDDGQRPPPANRGVPGAGAAPGTRAQPGDVPPPPGGGGSPTRTGSTADPVSDALARAADGPREPPPTQAAPQGAEPAPQQASTQRDLSAELHAALGDPSRCITQDMADTLPSPIGIRVEAHVSLTGVLTRTRVRAPGLPDDALGCVESMARSARLRSPIPDAPRTVTTTLTLTRGDPAKP
jgi:hypothetical protein